MRRLLTGAGLVAAVAAVTVGGSVAAAGPVETPAPREVTVAPPPTSAVCPAPPALVTGGGAEGAPATDPQFDSSPVDVTSSLRALAAPGTAGALTGTVMAGPAPAGGDLPAAPVEGDGPVLESDGAAPTALVAAPAPDATTPAALGALHTALTTAGDLRGLAATGCATPAASGWLVGGATSVGRSARLLLANPNSTATTVDLTVLTAEGPVQPAAGQGVVLAPGERRELLLEGLAPGQDAVAVRYEARGARVSALLVTTRLDGLTPSGVEVVSPSGPATRRQVVPGLAVDDQTALTLRLAAPGTGPVVVRWQLHGSDGPLVEGTAGAAVTVPAGTVVDVALPAGGPGDYALVVDADAPVLAAVATERGPEAGPTDVAWARATERLSGASLVVMPADDDVRARLALVASDGAAVVELAEVAADGSVGQAQRVLLDVGAVAAVEVGDGDDLPVALLVRPVSGSVHAATALTASADDGEDDLVAVVGTDPAPVAPDAVRIVSPPAGAWPGG